MVAVALALIATSCLKSYDFDSDSKADLMVVDTGNAGWYRLGSGAPELVWTGIGGTPAAGDYDLNGSWEPAEAAGSSFVSSGPAGTISLAPGCTRNTAAGQMIDAVPRDYDADGKTDAAWYCETTGTFVIAGQAPIAFGSPGTGHQDPDFPVPADYDGDFKADLATFNPRTGVWHIRSSATGSDSFTTFNEASGVYPAPGDYDGDGKIDIAYLSWYDHAVRVLGAPLPLRLTTSADNVYPAVADFDGDNIDDASAFDLAPMGSATGTWHIRSSSTGTETAYPVTASSTSASRVPASMTFDLVMHTSFWVTIMKCRFNPTGPGC